MRKITLLFLVICLSTCMQFLSSESRNTPPSGIVFRNVLNYSPSGQKLRTIYQTSVTATSTSQTPYDEYTTVTGRDYCDDVIYLNGAIEMVRTPNGYITPQGEYRISVKDNQGNVRLVTDLSGNVMERNNYYPYGSLFSENDIAQPYKYSGKEFENRNGLNIYDFHARYFDYAM